MNERTSDNLSETHCIPTHASGFAAAIIFFRMLIPFLLFIAMYLIVDIAAAKNQTVRCFCLQND